MIAVRFVEASGAGLEPVRDPELEQFAPNACPHRAIGQRAPCAVKLPVFEARHCEILGKRLAA